MKPSFGLPHRNPVSYNTEPLTRKDLVKRLSADKEQTDEHKAVVGYPMRTTFVDRIGRPPTELLFAAVRAHILQRADKAAPNQIFACKELYLMAVEDIVSQSHDGFTGKIFLGAYDGTNSIPITIRLDSMIGEALPSNTVVCIHAGGARADR